MTVTSAGKNLNKFSMEQIYQKLEPYYTRDEVASMIKKILKALQFRQKDHYEQEDFLKILRQLKTFGGNARFCASLLLIDATVATIRN